MGRNTFFGVYNCSYYLLSTHCELALSKLAQPCELEAGEHEHEHEDSKPADS